MACNCNNTDCDKVWTGTMLKFIVQPEARGFNPDENDWSVEIRYGSLGKVYKTFQRDELIKSKDGYIVVIDTEGLNGMVYAIVTAWIPDTDCEDNLRREVVKVGLVNIQNV